MVFVFMKFVFFEIKRLKFFIFSFILKKFVIKYEGVEVYLKLFLLY